MSIKAKQPGFSLLPRLQENRVRLIGPVWWNVLNYHLLPFQVHPNSLAYESRSILRMIQFPRPPSPHQRLHIRRFYDRSPIAWANTVVTGRNCCPFLLFFGDAILKWFPVSKTKQIMAGISIISCHLIWRYPTGSRCGHIRRPFQC